MRNDVMRSGSRWAEGFLTFAQVAVLCCAALSFSGCGHSSPATAATKWDPAAAAAYLDRRITWWMGWKGSARDHDTFCVSCHTAVPYALARSSLRASLSEHTPAAPERKLMDDVRRRVRLWSSTLPFYTDHDVAPGKSVESRGTEAVLSALMLAWDDAPKGALSPETVAAFDHMWAEQLTSGDGAGAWAWLDFDLFPWETAYARYYGAALGALAVGVAPENYQSRPEVQKYLSPLRDYLVREYPAQSLHDRVVLLWASTKLPGLLDASRSRSLVDELLRAQNPDGGWSLSALMRTSGKDGPALDHPESDGYATGLVTLALGQMAANRPTPQVERGVTWLVRNQAGPGGSWFKGHEAFWAARSLNKWRNPWSRIGRFMSDAATAYAVLALTESSRAEPSLASARK